MNLKAFAEKILRHETERAAFVEIPPEHLVSGERATPVEPDQGYIELWIHEMFLAHDRTLYKSRCPVVHTSATWLNNGELCNAVQVVGPGQLQDISGDPRRIISRCIRVLGPVPYQGGDLEFFLGLIACESHAIVTKCLDALATLSKAAGTMSLSRAGEVAGSLSKAVEEILRPEASELCLGLFDTARATVTENGAYGLCPGFRVVTNARLDRAFAASLWVHKGELLLGQSYESAEPPKGFDYILFEIRGPKRRDDWSGLEGIRPRLKALNDVLARSTSEKDVRSEFELFKGAIISSPDLTHVDRVRIIRGIRERALDLVKLRNEGLGEIQFLGKDRNGAGGECPIEVLGDPQSVGDDLAESDLRSVTLTELAATVLDPNPCL